ncbi:LuxR C-terminal-related transcriptional regulator [Gordonia sp. ABSL1-1]|uniref:helix-turn-helix transcriptional regulator n=1 Tax=Gordonia sp. ABSL1-1 TaxID=3053923 RepID=UPI0033655B91
MIHVGECVGREETLAAVAAEVDRSADDGVRIFAVTGEPGIGRTTFLGQMVADYRLRVEDPQVAYAHAQEWDARTPGAILAQLLQCEPGEVGALADDLHRRWMTDRPLLIVVDDAHRADSASVETLIDIADRHRAAPVTLVLTVPTGRLTDLGVQTGVGSIRVGEIALPGLTAAAIGQLARTRGIPLHPAVAERLHVHTGGNPRAVTALLTEVPSTVWSRHDADLPAPAYVRAMVLHQLSSCGPDGRALIEAAAILDPADGFAVTAELAGVADHLHAADEALATGLLTPATDLAPADFRPTLRSPMVRAAIVSLMGLAAAGAAHRTAAELVTDPVRKLRHLVAAAPRTDPELAERVAQLAQARAADGAWGDAAQLFRQAARLTEQPLLHDERLTRAVDALLAAGDCAGAGALIPAIESLRETPLRDATLAYLAILRGRGAEADVRLTRAWDIVNATRDPETAAVIAQRRVLDSLARCQGDVLVEWADLASQFAGAQSPTGVEAAVIRGLGMAWSGRPTEAMAGYLDLAATVRHGAQAQRVAMGRGWLELGSDDLDAARSSLETAVSMAALGGSDRITLWALAWLARTYFLTGDWDAALRAAREGVDLAGTSGIQLVSPLLRWTLTQIFSLRGDWDLAGQTVHDIGPGTDYEIMRIPALLAKAHLAEATADYAAVIHSLSPLVRLAQRTPALTEPGLWPWVDVLANALVIHGRLDDADNLLQPHEEVATARGHRSARARLGAVRGRLLGAAGDIDRARQAFETAVELLDESPNRYDLARTNFTYGQTLRRAGKRRDADHVIAVARDLFVSLGATTYVARCERELKAGGVSAPRGHRDDVELTAQEEAVTALVVRGMSNRDAAAELYISPKTVQYHLTRIYAKLGLRSRAELIARRA